MSRIKISALPETTKLAPTDLVTAVSSSGAIKTSVKLTIKTLADNLTTVTSSISASYAATASSADNFYIRQDLTGTNAVFSGTLSVQTIKATIISSSTVYSSGSNIFGDDASDVQQFTGSVKIKDSLRIPAQGSAPTGVDAGEIYYNTVDNNIYRFNGVSWLSAAGSSGTSGANGANGANGTSGTSGANGANGANGTSGTSGANGANGANGTSGMAHLMQL